MKKFGNIAFWGIVVVLVLAAAYTVYSKNAPGAIEIRQLPQKITAADFSLKDMDGKTVRLSDYRGKIVFLNFWASWCPPCREEMPDFDKANKEFLKKNDAVILSVNITDGLRETEGKARKYLEDNKLSLHVLFDTGGKVAGSRDYNITGIPTTFIINRDGTIYNSVTGPMSEKTLLNLAKNIK